MEVNEGDGDMDRMMEDITIDIDAVDELLYTEETFLLPDFPSMSSPSPLDDTKKNPSSSSSSSSWTFLSNPSGDEAGNPDTTNFLESFLDEDIESMDPNSLFPDEENGAMTTSLRTTTTTTTTEKENEKEELGKVFLDWLKNNRDAISAEDLRSIKLNEATIDCAAARLGGGRQGRMQLVKLILAWVQNHHLHRNESLPMPIPMPMPMPMPVPPLLDNAPANPNPSPSLECNLDDLGYTPWPHYLQFSDPVPMPMPYPMPMQMQPQTPCFTGVNSAMKEARKKRMARQRRYSALQQNRSQHHPYQSHATGNQQKCNESRRLEKQQSWKKSEKKLRFLLQKVLKQTDVGSLGRIVLPKKEAESHLPKLDTSDGISIPMEDIGTSRVWNMRYRYWPNNKSRMYLLENTGDFVRINGLQEGDFIVLYLDVERNKYMIRGVKVRRPPLEPKESAASISESNDGTMEEFFADWGG